MQEGEAWRSITVIQQQGLRACVLMFAAASFLGSPIARAQAPGLGGYGASSSMPQAAMGGSAPIIPYGGSLSGFMPYRMGGGGSGLSFPVRNSSTIGLGRSSFRLSSMSREMGMPRGPFGEGIERGMSGSLLSPIFGRGMDRSMNGAGQSVMPPDFGYPFYQPSLLGSSTAFTGMPSM